MLLIWLLHVVIAGVFTAPIVFLGRKRVRWQAWESVVFVLPFAVWAVLMFSDLSIGHKSLANLGEPFYFAAAVPVAALVRVAIGGRIPEHVSAGGLIALMCMIASGVFLLVPPLPE